MDEVQSGQIAKPPVDEQWITVPGGPAGSVPVRVVRPAGASGTLPARRDPAPPPGGVPGHR